VAALDDLIAEWVGRRTLEEALETFEANEVAAAPVLDVAQAMEDPQFQAREVVERIIDDDLDDVAVPAVQPRLSSTPGRISRLGGPLGGFTDEVLADELGMSPEEILGLHEDGIV
jgi:crotonobetainyl-CoA:carnitine CoA-transferase CaiB-like acyl-CoA transferase